MGSYFCASPKGWAARSLIFGGLRGMLLGKLNWFGTRFSQRPSGKSHPNRSVEALADGGEGRISFDRQTVKNPPGTITRWAWHNHVGDARFAP